MVPERLAETAVPGCRVRVRFAGQLVDGFLLSRQAASEHGGRLAYLERVVSPEAVLTPDTAGLARAVADRYAGTLADVLRLAIPPRHAATEAKTSEAKTSEAKASTAAPRPAPGPWARYPAGEAFLTALADGRAPRAVWSALPGAGWAEEIALATAPATPAGQRVGLPAGLGPAERYRRWLSVLRGEIRVVAGLRAAMSAPVQDLGLVVVWDDGDDLHEEPRAPYPHAREVLALRAHRGQAAALIGGFARTAEATQLVASGWARPITASRPTVRSLAPLIRGTGDDAELAKDGVASAAR